MYHIFICDDDDEFLKSIKEKIGRILMKNKISINLYSYTSAKNMIFDLQDQNLSTAIFFMDIVMPGLSGIEAAKIIRGMGIDAQIIFLTSSKKHVFEALDIMPMHYLIKRDFSELKFEKVLMMALKTCFRKSNDFFCYKVSHTIKRISVDKIMFFEVKNRVVLMYKDDGSADEFYATIKNLEDSFKFKSFIRIHRSYLVNLEHISSLEKKHITFKNGAILPIGEKYSEDVKNMYEKFTINDIKVC